MENKTITYPYYDENYVVLYSKIRTEGIDGKKDFRCQREENGQIINNLDGCRKILYRLPEVIYGISENLPIFLVEGEKDANTLLSKGLIATTAITTSRWEESFTQTLTEADVILLYDNDKAGITRRDMISKQLYGKVARLRIIDLPGLEYREKHGLDITDWLEMGNTIETLHALVEKATDYKPAQLLSDAKANLRTISIDELFELELPEREMLLSPFLPSQGLVLLVAKRGVGKTHIALGIAYAVASGSIFLRWSAPTPKKVLYIDGEMPAVLMKERLLMISTMGLAKPASDFLKLLTPDLQDQPMPDLSLKEGRDSIESLLENVDLVIIDNISCLFRSGSENESESWQEAQEWALDLRRRGKSVLFVHHAGKSGNQRGTSKREDILDTVIILKHAEDYKPEEGAHFEIMFDKSRHFSGEDARSFQAHLKTNGNIWWWELSDAPEEEEIKQIAIMRNSGYTIKQIADETKFTKAQVEYRLAKAKEKGLIK